MLRFTLVDVRECTTSTTTTSRDCWLCNVLFAQRQRNVTRNSFPQYYSSYCSYAILIKVDKNFILWTGWGLLPYAMSYTRYRSAA